MTDEPTPSIPEEYAAGVSDLARTREWIVGGQGAKPTPSISAGMKAYGPEHPEYPNVPGDWDGGKPVAHRGGLIDRISQIRWQHFGRPYDIIAYTPTPSPDQASGVERREVAFLVALAEAGIPADIQDLLVAGNPTRGIAPGALRKGLRALAMEVG